MNEQRNVAGAFPKLPEGKNNFDRMIQGLRRKDPELNEICTDILVRAQTEGGANGVPFLLVEAMLPGRKPDHRIRILEVVRRIGAPLSPDDFLMVMALTNHSVERVALKATELIAELRPSTCVAHTKTFLGLRVPGAPPARQHPPLPIP